MAYEVKYTLSDFTPDVGIGITLPITGPNGQVFNLSYSTEEQLLSNLTNLILTRRGERLYQPTFGTTIQDSLFEPNTLDLVSKIKFSITEAIKFWLPYVTLNDVIVTPVIVELGKTEENGVTIKISVSLNGQESEKQLTYLATTNTIQLL
jgi:phage baseplate assembly protein W